MPKITQDAMPTDLRLFIEEFIRLCSEHNAAVTGFVFHGDPAYFVQFGNTKDKGDALKTLHARLCDMAYDGREVVPHVVQSKPRRHIEPLPNSVYQKYKLDGIFEPDIRGEEQP